MGPRDVGKTFIARKLASMMSYNFVDLVPSDLASIYVHGTQRSVRSLRSGLRDQRFSSYEIDAFIPRRDQGLYQHYSAEVNEFLAQI